MKTYKSLISDQTYIESLHMIISDEFGLNLCQAIKFIYKIRKKQIKLFIVM
jgi:hypothetical protein